MERLIVATKRVVDDSELSALPVTLQLQWKGWASYPPEPPWWNNVEFIYCLFQVSRPLRPYRLRLAAALQLCNAPSCPVYLFGRLGSRALRGPGQPGPPAQQVINKLLRSSCGAFDVTNNISNLPCDQHCDWAHGWPGTRDDMPLGRPQFCVAAVSEKLLPYNIIVY